LAAFGVTGVPNSEPYPGVRGCTGFTGLGTCSIDPTRALAPAPEVRTSGDVRGDNEVLAQGEGDGAGVAGLLAIWTRSRGVEDDGTPSARSRELRTQAGSASHGKPSAGETGGLTMQAHEVRMQRSAPTECNAGTNPTDDTDDATAPAANLPGQVHAFVQLRPVRIARGRAVRWAK